MNQLKLTTQINIIFSFVTLLGCVVFLFIINLTFDKAYENQNRAFLTNYFEEVKGSYQPNSNTFNFDNETVYNDYFVIKEGEVFAYSYNNIPEQELNLLMNKMMQENFKPGQPFDIKNIPYTRMDNISYMGQIVNPIGQPKYGIFVMSNTQQFITDMTGNIPFYTTIAFLNILVLGNVIIWLWSSHTVGKLKELQEQVDQMVYDDYQTEVNIDNAAEEIVSLSKTIDNMRAEIKSYEETKKEMIQNLGHDLKTPIAVIKSYAEAILDGIEDKEAAALIIKQSDVLTKKVRQIIEYRKIGYIDAEDQFELVSFKEIIHQVVNHYKYITDKKIILDIDDDWQHVMVKDACYVAISNIVDNAVRYVKTKIMIQLKNKKLTIFNDGEPIEENVLPKIFKAYEKGSKGQFGLGLAIVKETMDRFGLKVSVQNHANGVLFTIELQ